MLSDFYDVNKIADITATNKFMPIPPKERIFTGGTDEDFRTVGADIMRHAVRTTEITPSSRVLEVGSGIGRVALPLTQYLRNGHYVGIDIAFDGVSWCRENITSVYPNFVFHHYDVMNEYYNQTGQGTVADTRLPDGPFDAILLASVFTHLTLDDVQQYLPKFRDALPSGGHVWGTWFIVEDGIDDDLVFGTTQVPLRAKHGEVFYSTEDKGTLAVAYPEKLLRELFNENGFEITHYELNTWRRGREKPGGGFQDVVVARKR